MVAGLRTLASLARRPLGLRAGAWALLGVGQALLVSGALASGNTLLDVTNIVGASTVAPPVTFSFSVAAASVVTVKDLVTPAAFQQLEAALVSGDALVGTPVMVSSTTHSATLSISAAGNYTVYLAGLPSGTPSQGGGFGSYEVCVGLQASPNTCTSQTSGTLAIPSPPSSSDTSTVNTSFTSSSVAGTYTITLTDDAFPSALQMASAGISQGSTPIVGPVSPGTPTQFQAQANTSYQLLVGAQASSSTNAALYGVQITDPTGAPVFSQSFPVGELASATIVDNPTSQTLTLTTTDYTYPQALSNLSVAVTQGGALLGSVAAAGTTGNTQFNAAAGSTDVWTYAVAGTQPGTYNTSLASPSASLLSTTAVVNPTSTSGSSSSFAFLATLPSAGTYHLAVTDLQFPGAFQTPPLATVAQNGTQLTVNSSGQFSGAAGAAIIVVTVGAPSSGSGIFEVVVTTGSGTTVLDQTQAVGGTFTTQKINVGTTGGFQATLTDQAFPQKFSDLGLVVSVGGQVLGKVYGAGSFAFNATAGDQYVVTFVATPSTQTTTTQGASVVPDYGLYTIKIASAAPTVSLSASASSVSSGGTVTLTWSSQYATSCTAAGVSGWTGNEATSGSLAVQITSTATLSLTCTGPGGSAMQSVKVSATNASGGGGGGGALAPLEILGLLTLLGAKRLRLGSKRLRLGSKRPRRRDSN